MLKANVTKLSMGFWLEVGCIWGFPHQGIDTLLEAQSLSNHCLDKFPASKRCGIYALQSTVARSHQIEKSKQVKANRVCLGLNFEFTMVIELFHLTTCWSLLLHGFCVFLSLWLSTVLIHATDRVLLRLTETKQDKPLMKSRTSHDASELLDQSKIKMHSEPNNLLIWSQGSLSRKVSTNSPRPSHLTGKGH